MKPSQTYRSFAAVKCIILLAIICFIQLNLNAQNVGIGISTPTAKLHVVNNGSTVTGLLQSTNSVSTSPVLNVQSGGHGNGILVSLTNTTSYAYGIEVNHSGGGYAFYGRSTLGTGVYGTTLSISAAGVIGNNYLGEAVVGMNRGGMGVGAVVGRNDSSGYGVRGFNTKDGIGVLGQSGISGGTGVAGRFENVNAASNGAALEVETNGLGTGIDVELTSSSSGARGVDITNNGVGTGLFAIAQGGTAVWGIASSNSGGGVVGDHTFGEAVVGRNRGGNGIGAVVGRNDSSGYGVRGFNTKTGIGVLGQAGISSGTGVAGRFENQNAANTRNVLEAANTPGASGFAVFASHNSSSGAGIKAVSYGTNGNGVIGEANTGNVAYAIWGISSGGYAGYFTGDVHVVGVLSKSSGTFKIDHPQDPANKYLIHSFVESPDMMNIYNGNITTDENGNAIVQLPAYFEAENIDYRYQLTVMDERQFAQARVAKKITGNQFLIKTDKPNIEISWMVTGVRNDAFAQKHRVIAEVEKAPNDKGKYLNPIENGQPETAGINYQKMKECNIGTEDPAAKISQPVLLGLPSENPAAAAQEMKKSKEVQRQENPIEASSQLPSAKAAVLPADKQKNN